MPMSTPEAQREYQRIWIARRRAEFLENKVCAVCGDRNRLELDHIDPATKLLQPAALWGMSPTNPKRIAELAKCQILCERHHLEKTTREQIRRFCIHGHDTSVLRGRKPNGVCRTCAQIFDREKRQLKRIPSARSSTTNR